MAFYHGDMHADKLLGLGLNHEDAHVYLDAFMCADNHADMHAY